MLWQIDGSQLEPGHLGPLVPERILFEFDGPRSYTTCDPEGDLLFLHQCGESEDTWRYFVVPFNESLLRDLESGRLDLRQALTQPRLWIADIDTSGAVVQLMKVTNRAVVEKYLPLSGTMFYPEMEPLLSVRSVGADVEIGRATLGMLHNALENVRGALKILAEYAVGEVVKPGQPKKELRRYYDLPAVVLPGSVRVSVLPPPTVQEAMFQFDDVWQRMAMLLNLGLTETMSPPDQTQDFAVLDDERRAALQAIQKLAPPSQGSVQFTEISGRLVSESSLGFPVKISRAARTVVRRRLRTEPERQPRHITERGYISELDREEATCLLRDEQGMTLRKMSFDEAFFDEVKDAFDSQRQVEIITEVTPPIEIANLLALAFISA